MSKTKISIDYKKCTTPEECRKCVGVCQPVVLSLTFTDKDFHTPKDWKIVPIFPRLCIHCMLCVEICPEQAINVYT